MKAARITIALAVLGGLALWFASTRSGEEAATIALAPKPRLATATANDSGALTMPATSDAIAEAKGSSEDSARIAVMSDSVRVSTSAIGRLVVRAVDATTNEPLRSFSARLASDTRIADEHSSDASGEFELPLTPDTYAIVVSAPGYESLELEPTQVTAGETNRLEPAKLRGGVGRIMVEVFRASTGGRSLEVELIGAGRHPCEHCGEIDESKAAGDVAVVALHAWDRIRPCPACGFARDRSRMRLGAAPRCEFENLASGNYALRVRDDRGFAVCQDRELALRESESARVEFDLSSQRYLELEFFDVDGRSLSEEWRARLADGQEESEIVSMESAVRMIPIALTFFDDKRDQIATASLIPPQPQGTMVFGVGRGRSMPGLRGAARATVDRTRGPDDKLWPEHAVARFNEFKVACDVEDNGLARVGPLPNSRLELHATAERFIADATVPASRATTRVSLKLQPMSDDPQATAEFATYSAAEMAGMK